MVFRERPEWLKGHPYSHEHPEHIVKPQELSPIPESLHEKLLAEALLKLLVKIGVARQDAEPTYTELLMATEEYIKSSPTPESLELTDEELLNAMTSVIHGKENKRAILQAFPKVNESIKAIAKAQLQKVQPLLDAKDAEIARLKQENEGLVGGKK